MSISSLLSEYIHKTSDLKAEGPSQRISEENEYSFNNEHVDVLFDKIIEHGEDINEDDIPKVYQIYVNLRESKFLDNYMYLYFPRDAETVFNIANFFVFTLGDMVQLVLENDEDRILFLNNMKRRVSRLRSIRNMLNKRFPNVEIDDNKRYLDIIELEKNILYELDEEMISVKEGPESDHFLKSIFKWDPTWDVSFLS